MNTIFYKINCASVFRKYFLFFLLCIFIFSCGSISEEAVIIDFDKHSKESNVKITDESNVLKVAIASVISPKETYMLYEKLFEFISSKLNMAIEFVKISTYIEVNDLLKEESVDLAFICTGPYLDITDYVDLLVVPVCNGEPYYQAYVITNNSTGITHFEEFKGLSFVYTDPISNTGKMYPENRIKGLGEDVNAFFSSTVYSYSHDISIQMVSRNLVAGASVDGLIYDYIAVMKPEEVANIRIIEKSEKFGIPPIVVPKSASPEIKSRLRDIFLSMHHDVVGKSILHHLHIDSFMYVTDTLYDSMRKPKVMPQ